LSWTVAGKDVGEQTVELQGGIPYLKRAENRIKIGTSFCKDGIQCCLQMGHIFRDVVQPSSGLSYIQLY